MQFSKWTQFEFPAFFKINTSGANLCTERVYSHGVRKNNRKAQKAHRI